MQFSGLTSPGLTPQRIVEMAQALSIHLIQSCTGRHRHSLSYAMQHASSLELLLRPCLLVQVCSQSKSTTSNRCNSHLQHVRFSIVSRRVNNIRLAEVLADGYSLTVPVSQWLLWVSCQAEHWPSSQDPITVILLCNSNHHRGCP